MSRKIIRQFFLISTVFAVPGGFSCARIADATVLIAKKTIALPGVKGRIDHMAFDSNGQRMFICALGNNSVEVVDLANDKVIHSIKNIVEPQGIVFDAEKKFIAVTSGGDGWLRMYDSETFAITDSILIGPDADNIRAGQDDKLYVGYDGGVVKVHASPLEKEKTYQTDGHAESFQLDMKNKRLYVNVPDADETEVYDLAGTEPVAKWKAQAKDNFPMAIDTSTDRVFIAYRHPSTVVITNSHSGSVISRLDCSGDADDIFYDAEKDFLFVSSGEGFVDVFSDSASTFTRIQHLSSRALARTSFFDEQKQEYFIAVPAFAGKPAELRIYDLQ